MSRTRRTRARAGVAVLSLVAAGTALVAAATGSAAAPTGSPATPSSPAAAGYRSACPAATPGHYTCFAEVRAHAATHPAGSGGGGRQNIGFRPRAVQQMFHLNVHRGKGTTVAIVDAFDNPRAEHDLAVYRKKFGLPACTTANGCFRKVNQGGGSKPPAADPGWGVEIDLDLEAVSATCPQCHILLVEANNNSFANLGRAENRAVKLGARIVSNSYGGSEFKGIVNQARKYYTHPGVATLVASDDYGFSGGPAFPASWKHSIAVGGVQARRTGSSFALSAWYAGGSGCSAWIAKPSWQHDTHCLTRTVADVSALAQDFAMYDTFKTKIGIGYAPGFFPVAGTSVATPLVAGMVGLAGNPRQLGTAQYLYRHRSAFRDVTRGSNGYGQSCGRDYLCTARKGYDAPTGVGVPRGVAGL